MSDVTTPQATADAAAGRDDHATTSRVGTSRYATVREAADELGVSAETIRRMIRAGKLRAERVHRPQGSAFLVELPDATGDATASTPPGHSLGRHGATDGPVLSPALLAAEAWVRGVVEPLTQTITEQQRQLVNQAETIGRLQAELQAAKIFADALQMQQEAREAPQNVQDGTLDASGSTQAEEPFTELLPATGAPEPPVAGSPWWRRWLAAAYGW